jgi:hypothetical protein
MVKNVLKLILDQKRNKNESTKITANLLILFPHIQ